MNAPLVTIEKRDHFYLVRFHEVGNDAVDSWLAQVDQLHRLFQPQDYVSYKLVTPFDKSPSLAYVMKASRESIRRNPHRPHTRTAVMYYGKDAPLLGMLDLFLRWLTLNPRDQVRFFNHDDDDDANEWLRWQD